MKDIITIPERVHQGDFVLKLTEGVSHAEQTLRDYVVTPQLVQCFDNALGFIRQALEGHSSKAAYLHGSFGAGKSHFMAVLNLLLAGNVQARSITELADLVAHHNGWTQGRRFLLVPYHMIGARDMESAILGQYADYVRRLHPEAPVPGFYLADRLFQDAQGLRSQLGDEPFLARLNAAPDGSWGDLDGGWDAGSFESATLEAPNGEERIRLVSALIQSYFPSYAEFAANFSHVDTETHQVKERGFVGLDLGLSIMSRHAQALGYDAVILFLDELILWLASRAADVSFVSSEGTKLVKLVEATHADRPIPLVSFVARQRDLRELVGDNLAGALQLQFADVLKHWEARFHVITLEDRNLPAIARRRVLRPSSEASRQELEQAFHGFLSVRREVLDTLLTTTADRELFRQVYPFSPALVQALIAVSSVLQRERTALKLMLQLLVDRREDLELGQIIPVGDLYDVIADGDEPFSDAMRIHFENAKRLYHQKLLPLLERTHGVTWQAIKEGSAEVGKARNLRNDARLIKTLLLAALVPEVETLKALTAQRLAALNHGSFRSPIPGREGQDVLRRCRDWAAEVGEIKVTDDANPLISIAVTGVDIEPIVRGAGDQDNAGNRRRKIRELLFDSLGIADTNDLFTMYTSIWRGTRREVELVYENVREMADDRLRGRDGSWTVVVDYPFDAANRTPADDLARLSEYRGGDTRTLVWLPSFFSERTLRDLGRLVVLDYILTGERFNDYAGHLSLVDRGPARALAKNSRDQLQSRLRQCLEVAYGIAGEPRDAIASRLSPDDQFRSLDPTLRPRPPVGADLKGAFEGLLDQLFSHQFPAHPRFDTEVKAAALKKVWAELGRALESTDGRVPVMDKATRALVRSIAGPLHLGEMGETHFVLGQHWKAHFEQAQARAGGPITVARLRQWLDLPAAMGLPTEAGNLIVLVFAGQTNRSFFLNQGPFQPSLDNLPGTLELRAQVLPSLEEWERALARAGALFGLTTLRSCTAANVAKLVEAVLGKAREARVPLASFSGTLQQRLQAYGAGVAQGAGDGTQAAEPPRLTTARSAQALLAALVSAEPGQVVCVLAQCPIATSEAAMARTLAGAKQLDESLRMAGWRFFEAVTALSDHRRTAALGVKARIGEVLAADEHVIALKPALDEQEAKALRLLTDVPKPREAKPPEPEPPKIEPPKPGPETVVVRADEAVNLDPGQACTLLDAIRTEMEQDRELRLSVSWRLLKTTGKT
jgi:hypothetical protein